MHTGGLITAPFRSLLPKGALWPGMRRALGWQPSPHPSPPTPKAQLTLPLSTISFCRLVDVVTSSRMACQDQDLRHTGGSPLSYSPPPGSRPQSPPPGSQPQSLPPGSQPQSGPLGSQLAAHLHEVCAGIEDPVGWRGGKRREAAAVWPGSHRGLGVWGLTWGPQGRVRCSSPCFWKAGS